MDCKKFIQLVEEKKKRVLERKETPLKWEQKLEAAAKASADAEVENSKAQEILRVTLMMVQPEEEIMQSVTNVIGDRSHSSGSDSSSNEDDNAIRRNRAKHPKRHRCTECSASDSSSDEGSDDIKRRSHAQHHRRRWLSHSHELKSSDSDRRCGRRSQSLGKSSDENNESRKRAMHESSSHHCRRRHHHNHGQYDLDENKQRNDQPQQVTASNGKQHPEDAAEEVNAAENGGLHHCQNA
ncbi:hypothetical protein Acr_25g0003490 [Actinidia rufa]|uniref:Uncharacterized protein n=1 Tax=Actinidia rufa TaxID=165716 RepID=A0A7J0GYM6_9ERIC|nr:hypothetical protein Acr_25g0003490 [Actinidia rufa]